MSNHIHIKRDASIADMWRINTSLVIPPALLPSSTRTGSGQHCYLEAISGYVDAQIELVNGTGKAKITAIAETGSVSVRISREVRR